MTTVEAPARPGSAADAIAGVVPQEVVRPRDATEVAEILRSGNASGRSVVAVGGRSKLGWCPPPSSCDLVLETAGLNRVVEHTAGDLVVVAEAGVRLDALQEQLGAHRQMLALDPPEEGATLGGIVSANASGPRRLRYGTARDLLIGVTVVLADGSTAKAGGKVVKNVAGYDLGKLYTGAHGTLGVVVSTTWRLHPLPRAARAVVREVSDPDEAGSLSLRIAHSALTPSAVELTGTTGGPMRLVALFEAIPESVTAQATSLVDLLDGGDIEGTAPDGFGSRPTGGLVLRIAHVPAALPQVLRALPAGTCVVASSCSGVMYAALGTTSGVAALDDLRASIAPFDGSAVVIDAPADIREELDHWGPVGDALDLMRRVKLQFDPDRRLSPGRFVGGM
jgi:glycolate dehydrogenase FAD-binding subunit